MRLLGIMLIGLLLAACTSEDAGEPPTPTTTHAAPTADLRSTVKEAYVYGFPMVDNYRVMHAYFVDKDNPEYKGDWNQIHNIARVYTPSDTAVQTPNSDTPYSWLGVDLRNEPLVLTVPPVEDSRYLSLQFIDLYTTNFAYVGTRTTGNAGGKYLLAGPNWQGEKPAGVDEVLRSDTELGLVLYRTQLFDPADIDNVKKIQAGFGIEPLSGFQDQPAPPAAPVIDFPAPLSAADQRTSPEFFDMLNFALQFAPMLPDEQEMRDRFASVGIEAGKKFDFATRSAEDQQAIRDGMADALAEFDAFKKNQVDTGKVGSAQFFGTRADLNGNYLYRMAGAVLGIYGNTAAEALYPAAFFDSTGAPLDGSNRYTYRFAPGQLPPVDAFWSLTMYNVPQNLLVANPIDRYLINSSMLPNLVKDPDGGVTLYLQRESPGAEKEANWLPAPEGPFVAVLRMYLPRPEALDGQWQPPKPQKV
ncbi:DUF1254 domain-containing protein [Mycolicibacterium alvei]|uniref:Cell envelope protein n=2 Tax=Mycolicibacterium alvei TaxID=67081 RepID=A0A6N4UX49_9MYCO|nr:hypothetical protein MALV_36400 [Mycolicibacterium alvei]